MRSTGIWLRDKREEFDYTQQDVAEVFDLNSTQYISNIERGIAPLPLTMVSGLAILFDIEVISILDKISDDWKANALKNLLKVTTKQASIIERLKNRTEEL